jgi:SAM-dependent methyltransferase
MHEAALAQMDSLLDRWMAPALVLDVGSYDVNGNYRAIVERRGWEYVGLDLQPGTNVDVVAISPYDYPFPDGFFNIVISGSTAEHIAQPWQWIHELARVLKPGGMLAIITHASWPLHRFPKDYWRFMPDGLELLFDMATYLDGYDIRLFNGDKDIYGVAWRRAAS